ncbi:hypothetical protein [Nannocystis pusilla]|uniref:hypothetical protein n=1 Tax=Nannocystis pusilla TaxID=889268 RepID=UPI003B767970
MGQIDLSLGSAAAEVVDLLVVDTCQEKWKVEPGECFWLKGQEDHILLCGDAHDSEAVAELADHLSALMVGRRRVILTDPPYGLGYESGFERGPRVSDTGKPLPSRRSDRSFGSDAFDPGWMIPWRDSFSPEAVYLFTSWTVLDRWKLAMELVGWGPKHRLVWDKMHYGAGNTASYGDQLEDILVWYAQGHSPNWRKREGNLWAEAREFASRAGRWAIQHQSRSASTAERLSTRPSLVT